MMNRTIHAWRQAISERRGGLLRYAGKELSKTVGVNAFVAKHLLSGGVGPALGCIHEIARDLVEPLVKTARRQQPLGDGVEVIRQRFAAAGKYSRLISEYGPQLFGSARFEGELRLAENSFFTLSYLPPKPGSPRRPAIFHAGGFIPFSDRLFRLLPETNFFSPFLQQGFPVYAMEVRTDKPLGDLSTVTIDRLIDNIEGMSDVAFRHNGGRKLVLEGYCGLGMPAMAYIAAKPTSAEAKFGMTMLIVSPIDGRECTLLAAMVKRIPDYLLFSRYIMAELLGGAVSGKQLRGGIDIPLDTFFIKTSLGRFFTGWKRRKLHGVSRIEDLDASGRREIAGAYWISPENCDRHPLPVDVVRFSTELWRRGITVDGLIPATYEGRRLSFKAISEGTTMPLVNIYGGQDQLIPADTAWPLKELFADRYTHVVHENAGHVSYVFTPEVWARGGPGALEPNPMDLIRERYSG